MAACNEILAGETDHLTTATAEAMEEASIKLAARAAPVTLELTRVEANIIDDALELFIETQGYDAAGRAAHRTSIGMAVQARTKVMAALRRPGRAVRAGS